MTFRVVDDFSTAWSADSSGLWTATADPNADYLGADGHGMTIVGSPSAAAGPSPFVQRVFSPALDLTGSIELRLWLRTDRPATGTPQSPFYLVFEASADPADPNPPWSRLIRIDQPNQWQLQRLYVADMSAALRGAVAVLRLRGLDRTAGFTAAVDDLQAGTPQAVADTEAALLARLDARFSATDGGTPVPAIMNVPEVPPQQSLPYLLISPWAVLPMTDYQGGEEIDNETDAGAYVRPHPQRLRLDYRIDAFAAQRPAKARLIESVVGELAGTPRLLVGDEPLSLVPFEPDPLLTGPLQPGQSALYYRVLAWYETGPRVFRPRAVPFILTAPLDGVAQPETTEVPSTA